MSMLIKIIELKLEELRISGMSEAVWPLAIAGAIRDLFLNATDLPECTPIDLEALGRVYMLLFFSKDKRTYQPEHEDSV